MKLTDLPDEFAPQNALTYEQIDQALQSLPGWKQLGWLEPEEIAKIYYFAAFEPAWKFANAVVRAVKGSEQRLIVQVYGRTKNGSVVRLSFGCSGYITPGDLDLARRIEESGIAADAQAQRLPLLSSNPAPTKRLRRTSTTIPD